MVSIQDIPVQTIVDAVDLLIEETGVEDTGITIDRAYPHAPQQLACALLFADATAWSPLLAHVRTVDEDAGRLMSRACQYGVLGKHAVIFFPGVRFTGPLCPYDQKEVW